MPPISEDSDQSDEYVEGQDWSPSHDKQKSRTQRKSKLPAKLPGVDLAHVAQFHNASKVFLIIGKQSKDMDLLERTRELAASIRDGSGAVIYIDSAPLNGQNEHIDLQLQGDVDDVLGDILQEIDRSSGQMREPGLDILDDDMWCDIKRIPTWANSVLFVDAAFPIILHTAQCAVQDTVTAGFKQRRLMQLMCQVHNQKTPSLIMRRA
ncbi:hypothetical protein RhiTH_009499 [Rhizoctonia solani]